MYVSYSVTHEPTFQIPNSILGKDVNQHMQSFLSHYTEFCH